VRTTLDPKLQVVARKALVDGLIRYDESQGYRGAIAELDVSGRLGREARRVKALSDIQPWRLAVVLEANDQSARIGLHPRASRAGRTSKDV